MLVIPDNLRIVKKPKPIVASPAPPTSLTLVAARFEQATERLTMTFDRAISIAGYDGVSSRVNVPAANALMMADVGLHLSPDGRTVTAECEILTNSTGTTAWLTVLAGNGIVDASTGEAWPGVTELTLPFGEP